ncbi:hypothetical protein F4808DRAFT_456657 [Astrocystis sublimbata]|nr:hypothetical protein F4808DRAFT_456657 [Astrocystis sublimbata]
MQFSITAILPIVATFFALAQGAPAVIDARATNKQLADAQNGWAADTSKVSQFLSAVPTLHGAQLQAAAKVALAAEKNELVHKKVLDGAFGSDKRIVGANNVLVNKGTFQSVVDALAVFSTRGAKMSQADINALLRKTNTVRCGQVLPAIDTYFRVTGEKLKSGLFSLANRPNNC